MIVKLFPPGLLPIYKATFAKFPSFSARLNTWVTHLTTLWLMGPSNITNLEYSDGTIGQGSCLVIEKCKFLEAAGCVETCLHACKVPTQNFSYDEMGLAVNLQPNFTDFSCKFEFGKFPLPLADDPLLNNIPCLSNCTLSRALSKCTACL